MDLTEDVYVQAHQMFSEHCQRQEEIAQHQRRVDQHYRSKSRGAPPPMPPSRVQFGPKSAVKKDQEKRPEQNIEIDPATGKEVAITARPDGTTVRHRPIEEADLFLWHLTGKVPKSWKGKVDI